jgi:hypothetical protein
VRVIKHDLTEELAIRLLGWKWMSFVGIPTRGTEGYPRECRVRRLFSPQELKDKRLKDYFQKHDLAEATGEEPLSYAYCSSQGPAIPPRFIILVDD